jgi:outer membrane protein insertion porin family
MFLLLALSILPYEEIEVRGNVLVPKETILHHLGPVEDETLSEALRRLYDTGLFADVRFETEKTSTGLRLIVHVEEKPLLRSVRFEGDTARAKELRDALDLERRLNRPFGTAEAREVAETAKRVLGPGFLLEPKLVSAGETGVELVLEISREALPRIESISIEGNERLTDEELRNTMRLQSSGFFSWASRRDRFTPELLEEDLQRLRGYLRSLGYAASSVGPARVETLPGRRVNVFIEVHEGDVYRFGLILVEPGPLLEVEEARAWLPAPGSRFDGATVDAAAERLAAHYRDRGHAAVRVDRDERLRTGEKLADLALRVEEGPLYRVARITFEGNVRHPDEELRTFLDLVEGETFRENELDSGVRALMSLGAFHEVRPEVDVVSTPGQALVVIHMVERKPFEYLVGGGFTGIQGGSGTGQFIVRSVLGRAERIDLELDLGNRFRNFAAAYREPSIFSRRIFFDAGFRRTELEYPDETSEEATDLALRVGGPWGGRWRIVSGFRLSEFTLASSLEEAVPFLTPFLGERFRTHRASVGVGIDDRNRAVFPTEGGFADAGYEWVLGDVRLQRFRARGALHVPFDDESRHILALSAQAEALWPYGATVERGVPRFERLFLGSENDLRGFPIRGVGPRDDGVVVGGDRLVQGSVEYVHAVGARLRLSGFLDFGNVYATDFEGVELPLLRYDAGAEAQLLAPIANVPVRIGYGINLDRLEGEPPGRFFVSLAVRF